jgi:protein-glutamine gamma-glutamyltransferase
VPGYVLAGSRFQTKPVSSVPFTFPPKTRTISLSMYGKPNSGEFTLAAAIRRYFEVVLYLLIFTGFGTLASTGSLDLPTVLLVGGALLFRGYALARQRQVVLSERWTNLLTIACFGLFIADEFVISRTHLASAVHLVLFVMLVRLFSAQKDRDHYLLAVLAFLMVLAAAVLTVDSTFLLALAGFVLVAVTAFMLMEMMHSSERSPVQARDPNVHHAYRKLSFAIAGIAPVLLLLILLGGGIIFFVLPRVSAGYLSAYTGANDLTTGFSDRVELGRIGQIQQSKIVMMHVMVEGDSGGGTSLKLRGVALNNFDGQSWANTHPKVTIRRGPDGQFDLRSRDLAMPVLRGPRIHYRVTLEPYLSEVFFLLATPQRLQGNYRTVAEDAAGNVFDVDLERPVTRYEADSQLRRPGALRGHSDSPAYLPEVAHYLQLPALDARVKVLAAEITASAATPSQKAAAIENYLRLHYGYTLQLPQTMPRDPIANFLFERRQGHCEYFASAMAVMLRSIGIPSRLVNGFAGGEFNNISSEYVIRASDAHSWVEAYLPGEGWVEFDPTPSSGAEAHAGWNRWMQYMDALSSFWREWVVNYDFSHQFRLTQDANRGSRAVVGKAQSWGRIQYQKILDWARRTEDRIGDSTVKWGIRALVVVLLVLVAVSIPRLIHLIRRFRLARRPQKSPQIAASIWYERMLRQAAGRGWQKSPAQTPEEFAAFITDSQLRSRVVNFTEHYQSARFGRSVEDAEQLPVLYEAVKSSPKKHHVAK